MSKPCLLAMGLALAPTTLAAQKQFSLAGDHAAVYNLAGRVTIVAGSGSGVAVAATVVGRDAAQVTFDEGNLSGRHALVVRYPGDRIVYPEGEGSSEIEIRDNGTFGDSEGKRRKASGWDRVRVSSRGTGLEAHTDLRISVPAGTTLEVYLGVGRISATNINGVLHLDTASGDVDVSGSKGDLDIDTGSGNVKVTAASGNRIRIDTGSGEVEATGINAPELHVDTGSGSVTLGQVTSKSVTIDTGSGEVMLDLLTTVDQLDVDTGSGSVTVRMPANLSAQLAVDTGSGDIETDFPVTLRRTDDNELQGTIGGGAGTIQIETGSGDVRLLKK